MYALVDANNFYVSCERVFRPDLDAKPVVVLSNNDGCIISRSQEAKDLGLKMGEPAFKRNDFILKNNVCLFSSNYVLYGDMSNRVVSVLKNFSPSVEVYSIDESFLDLSGITDDLFSYGKTIGDTVYKNTGIPVGVGIAQTKTLAKLANKIAKKSGGVFVIDNEEKRVNSLKDTAIEDVWGIGRQYSKLLKKYNITTAFDFSQINDAFIRQKFTVVGLRTKRELLGEVSIEFNDFLPTKKAIAVTRAFGHKSPDEELLREAVASYAASCSLKLRTQKSVANFVNVFIHTDPFNKNEIFFYNSVNVKLPVASANQFEIVKYALKGLKHIFRKGKLYKKAGVIVTGIESEKNVQTNLFYQAKSNPVLMKSIDNLNSRYGKGTVKLAVQAGKDKWKLRQEKLSPRYTTKINETIQVK